MGYAPTFYEKPHWRQNKKAIAATALLHAGVFLALFYGWTAGYMPEASKFGSSLSMFNIGLDKGDKPKVKPPKPKAKPPVVKPKIVEPKKVEEPIEASADDGVSDGNEAGGGGGRIIWTPDRPQDIGGSWVSSGINGSGNPGNDKALPVVVFQASNLLAQDRKLKLLMLSIPLPQFIDPDIAISLGQSLKPRVNMPPALPVNVWVTVNERAVLITCTPAVVLEYQNDAEAKAAAALAEAQSKNNASGMPNGAGGGSTANVSGFGPVSQSPVSGPVAALSATEDEVSRQLCKALGSVGWEVVEDENRRKITQTEIFRIWASPARVSEGRDMVMFEVEQAALKANKAVTE